MMTCDVRDDKHDGDGSHVEDSFRFKTQHVVD